MITFLSSMITSGPSGEEYAWYQCTVSFSLFMHIILSSYAFCYRFLQTSLDASTRTHNYKLDHSVFTSDEQARSSNLSLA